MSIVASEPFIVVLRRCGPLAINNCVYTTLPRTRILLTWEMSVGVLEKIESIGIMHSSRAMKNKLHYSCAQYRNTCG